MDSRRILVGLVVVACVAGTFARVPVALAGCLPSGTEIVSSDPPDGFVDVRQHKDAGGDPDGISQFTVEFSESFTLTAGCIEVVSSGSNPPEVDSVTQDGDDWVIQLDGPVEPGETTAVVFDAGVAWVLIHSHPGDVNLNGTLEEDADLAALQTAITAQLTDPDIHDIDRDGTVDNDDLARLESVLEDAVSIGPVRTVLCCCDLGECTVTVASACAEEGASCPCVPNPCEEQP